MKRVMLMMAILCMVLSVGSMAMAEEAAPAEAAPAEAPKIAVNAGDPVAAWTGTDLASSKVVNSADFKGKEYALVFVNASCSACRGELGDLVKMDFGSRLDVMVVAVDAKPDRALTIYKDLLKVPYPILGDADQKLAALFDFSYSPATVIVDGNGALEYRAGGYSAKSKADIMGAFAKYTK
jgi:peroxiredoxin